LTAASNDYDFRDVFSRQLEALCGEGDVVLAISTSGGSENVIRGILTARRKGAFVIGLTGRGGGRIGEISDLSIAAAESVTARVQEIHVTVIHALCKEIEEALTNGI
jgi:D-sedoheptulose 7-phosphate isomerase